MDAPDYPAAAALSSEEWREMLDLLREIAPAMRRQTSPWMTTEEASEYLRMSPETLQTMRYRGGGPPYCRQGGRVVLYDRDDLNAWRRKGRATNTASERLAGVPLSGA